MITMRSPGLGELEQALAAGRPVRQGGGVAAALRDGGDHVPAGDAAVGRAAVIDGLGISSTSSGAMRSTKVSASSLPISFSGP